MQSLILILFVTRKSPQSPLPSSRQRANGTGERQKERIAREAGTNGKLSLVPELPVEEIRDQIEDIRSPLLAPFSPSIMS